MSAKVRAVLRGRESRLRRWLRPLRGLRRFAPQQLVARILPEWLSQLVGPRPLRLLRPHTLALIAGDHATALRLSLGSDGRVDEQSLTVALIAQWECGEREEAERRASEHAATGEDRRLRAVARFHLYLEDPVAAQAAYDRIGDPDAKLTYDLIGAWRRHGGLEQALRLLDELLALDPGSYHARALRDRTEGELEVVRWRWAADGEAAGPKPVATPAPEESIRVLHMVARSLPDHHAGSTFRTHYTVTAQRAAGIDAHVVTPCGFPGRAAEALEEHLGVPYHRLPAAAESNRMDVALRDHVRAASDLVGRLSPTLLHPASDYLNATVAIELGRRHGIPVVYEVRGFPEEYLRRRPASSVSYEKWAVRRQIEAECWRRADRIVTLADVMKEQIASKGVDPERIAVIPNAVDAETFAPGTPDRGLAARIGLRADRPTVGYISSFAAYEGIRYLIEAVARLTSSGTAVQLLLVGDGAEREHLEQLARRLGVADRTIFTGRVEHAEVGAYYDLIDIFVVPRTSEATTELVTPLKPFEAMAMKKALVVSGTAALSEMVEDGETGLMFAPEDAGALAAAIERLHGDQALRTRLGESAREWVVANRSWEANAVRYRELYESLSAEPLAHTT